MRSNSRHFLALLMSVAILTSTRGVMRAQTGGAGQNINVVTGTGTFTNDLDLYRKNEPVVGISSANPSHMLVAYNDARTVDAIDDAGTGPQSPGQGLFAKVLDFFRAPWRRDRDSKGEWEVEGPAAANQAWVGLSLTNNGGKNWFSGLHPGRYVSIPTDVDPGWVDAVQLNAFDAANDPVLATTPPHVSSSQGPVGDQFFLAGIAFNLPTATAPGQGVGFISRFTDRNNSENAQSLHYDGTKVLLKSSDFATPTAMNFFVDKPSIAAGPNGHVYAAFVVFDQNDPNKLSSKILFFSSANYGDTWAAPNVISQPLTRNQAPWILVDNNDDRIVYIGWRVFSNPLYPNLTNAVVGRRSVDGGLTFAPSVPYPVALLLKAFDQRQGVLPNTAPTPRSAAYPSAAMDGNGAIHVLMQEYVYPANYPSTNLRGLPLAPSASPAIGVPRITVTTSFNQGSTWTTRKAIDLGNGAGTQFMPTIAAVGEPGPTCSGKVGPRSKVIAMFYDARPSGIGVAASVNQGIVTGGDKQFDVRIAQASACSANSVSGLSFTPSEGVSQYQRSSTTPYPIVPIPVQPAFTPQYSAVNRGYTMSCKGNCSFSGDYIHLVPRVPYVKTASGAWKPTTAVMSDADRDKLPAAVVQGVWTDTRDAVLPTVGSPRVVLAPGASQTIDVLPWDFYNVADPTRFAACSNLGTRHQSVYSSEYTPGGLFASAPVTFRASTIPRSYPLYVENRTAFKKYYKLTIDPLAQASFDYTDFDPNVAQVAGKSTGFGEPFARATSVVIDSISSVTGAVVVGPRVNTPVAITVEETDSNGAVISPPAGAKTTVTLNTAGADDSSTETAVPAIGAEPKTTKPFGAIPSSGVANTTLGNPTPFSPNPFSPNPFSPNPFSPNPFSPNPFSPNPFSPNPFSPNAFPGGAMVYDVTDISYVITNDGQQTAAFNSVIEQVQNTPGNHVFQVLLNRAVPVSTVNYDSTAMLNCQAVDSALAVPISTIAVPFSPNPFSPNPFSPNPFSPNFSPNPFSPNPFSPNYPPIFSNSTFYVAPKGSTSGAVARLDDGGTISGRGPQQLARRSSDARIRNASLTPATPGEYIGEPVNDVMVLTLRDFLLTPPCTSNPTLPCGRPISPANVTVRVKAEVPNVDANGQFDPAGPATTGTQIAHHLAFTVQPTNTTSGGTITPPIKVEIRDTFDDIVTASAQQRQVSLAIAPLTCPGGTLSGTTTTLSSAGVATFSSVVITSSAGCSGVRLVASSGTLKQATSDPFDVTTLTLVNTQLLDAIVGSPYPPAPQSFQVLGGQAPYTFTIDPTAKVAEGVVLVPATLPLGISLSTGGVFSGTPTTVGNYAFRIIVTDAGGHTAAANFCIHVDPNQAAALLTTDLSQSGNAGTLAASLLDPDDAGVVVTNAKFTGSPLALGTFTGGGNAITGLGFHEGLVLSTGTIASAKGPNSTSSIQTNFNLPGDADLQALSGVSNLTHDAAILEFNFTPTCHDVPSCNVTFEYVFGSDEYHEYANSAYNDVFAFFLTDTMAGTTKNYALLPNVVPETPVSINTVNGGNPLGFDAKHPEFFRSNRTASDQPGPLNLQADGLTVPLQFNAPVISGHPYHIKIGIADVTDGIYDSMVFIKSGSFKVTHICPIVVQ